MGDHDAGLGVSRVLLQRFERERLPRVLKIKDRVDQGLALEDADLAFLERILNDAQDSQLLINSVPECRDLFARAVHLYRDITAKALENEESR